MDTAFLRSVKRRDRMARVAITIGGMAIILSVILILLLIGRVTLPLFQKADSAPIARFELPAKVIESGVLEVGVDEYLERLFVLDGDATLTFLGNDGRLLEKISAQPPVAGSDLISARKLGTDTFSLLWSDGSLTVERVEFTPRFDEQGTRHFDIGLARKAEFGPSGQEVPKFSLARVGSEGRLTRLDLLQGSRLAVSQTVVSEDMFGEEQEENFSFVLDDAGSDMVTAVTLDTEGGFLYAGTDRGALLRWSLEEPGEPQLMERVQAFVDRRAITDLALVLGDISLAVGGESGKISTWFPAPVEGDSRKRLRRIHDLEPHFSPIAVLVPSQRDKSLLSLDASGNIHLDHMTSERHLLSLSASNTVRHLAMSGRGNGVVGVTDDNDVILWSVSNPHPEVSFKTLFGKVWYESYDQPEYVWQSSSASDDFEPKFSLTPLIFGTFKGTFYAMIFAIPLALFGAIYTSQFGSPKMRAWVKPTVEVMAAIPSVVIGFLAALWFAPLVERHITSLFLSVAMVPTAFVVALILWQWLRRNRSLQKVERGYEFLAAAPVILLAVVTSLVLGPLLEGLLFGGEFKMWLFNETGARYDQRNNIVIAFALGFAVIPIIFTIAEDALSNVPPSLKAASLAVGASRWQTVWRVILPSASPGIFAGIMIGLGRAIGETMIVLMATGNTAIMEWSLFNGMRPLSSNIAVEIPEAPFGGSLYRILFLSACILFALTFVLNTVAEVVRQRLRKKYGRF